MLITCTGPDHITRPLVVFNTFTYRPKAAPADGIYQQMPCAFMGLAAFDRLPPAQYRVAAWRVDTRTSTASQLEDTYLLDWSLSRKVSRNLNTIVYPPLSFKADNRNGNLDAVTLLPDQRLGASGWAMDNGTSSIPRMVLITCTDSAGATRLLGTTTPKIPRPGRGHRAAKRSIVVLWIPNRGRRRQAAAGRLPGRRVGHRQQRRGKHRPNG